MANPFSRKLCLAFGKPVDCLFYVFRAFWKKKNDDKNQLPLTFARIQVTIGFGSASQWLKKWHECNQWQRSKENQKISRQLWLLTLMTVQPKVACSVAFTAVSGILESWQLNTIPIVLTRITSTWVLWKVEMRITMLKAMNYRHLSALDSNVKKVVRLFYVWTAGIVGASSAQLRS